MKTIHVPRIDARYWTAITLASVFGTNMGDYYAHNSGLGLTGGLPILIGIVALGFIAEHFDKLTHQFYYWLVIIIIRTGATNIADYLAFRVHLNAIGLSIGLAIFMAVLVLVHSPMGSVTAGASSRRSGLPNTNTYYWVTMLAAGVFGTVLGDVCEHAMGEGVAAILLGAILAVTLFIGRGGLLQMVYYYWLAVAVARTTGTAIGDWIAENKILHIGLTASTIMTGIAFIGVLLLWKGRLKTVAAPA